MIRGIQVTLPPAQLAHTRPAATQFDNFGGQTRVWSSLNPTPAGWLRVFAFKTSEIKPARKYFLFSAIFQVFQTRFNKISLLSDKI